MGPHGEELAGRLKQEPEALQRHGRGGLRSAGGGPCPRRAAVACLMRGCRGPVCSVWWFQGHARADGPLAVPQLAARRVGAGRMRRAFAVSATLCAKSRHLGCVAFRGWPRGRRAPPRAPAHTVLLLVAFRSCRFGAHVSVRPCQYVIPFCIHDRPFGASVVLPPMTNASVRIGRQGACIDAHAAWHCIVPRELRMRGGARRLCGVSGCTACARLGAPSSAHRRGNSV